MINIVDNFLEQEIYESVYQHLSDNEFVMVEVGDKPFWVQYTDEQRVKYTYWNPPPERGRRIRPACRSKHPITFGTNNLPQPLNSEITPRPVTV